jgi:hypothetical protein
MANPKLGQYRQEGQNKIYKHRPLDILTTYSLQKILRRHLWSRNVFFILSNSLVPSEAIVILYRDEERMNIKKHELILGGIILAAGIAIIILILMS